MADDDPGARTSARAALPARLAILREASRSLPVPIVSLMVREGTAERLVRNILASGAASVLGILLSLVLLPFLIHHLGAAAYGTWALALSLSFVGGYASLTDLGIESSAVRFVAEGRAAGDHEAVNRTVSTALGFFTSVAFIVTPL